MRSVLLTLGLTACATTGLPTIPLDGKTPLAVANGKAEFETYRDRPSLLLAPLPGHEGDDGSVLAILTGRDFHDGTIEVDVAGVPRPDAPPTMRGFIGVAFRVQDDGQASEMIYVRPLNARSQDQLQRNHSVQYVSDPGWPWQKLRAETPGAYESYADMEPGAWTHLRIVVAGATAKLYVNGASQPCLVVNDLKRGDGHGLIGLWAHDSTIAHFAGLSVR